VTGDVLMSSLQCFDIRGRLGDGRQWQWVCGWRVRICGTVRVRARLSSAVVLQSAEVWPRNIIRRVLSSASRGCDAT